MAVNPLGMNQGTNSFIRFEDDGGTVNTQVIDVRQGTITKLQGGTLGNLVSGTINSATAVLNSGTINVATAQVSGGTLGLLQAGTITRLEGGTMQLSGTPNVNIISGSIQVTAGTEIISGGSIAVTVGTMVGAAGSAAAVSGNPLYIAGQGGNGTAYPILTDTSGQPKVIITAGTVGSLPNIPGGTINVVAAGTINSATVALNSGTINVATAVITTLPNLPQGSIQVTAGTVTGGTLTNLVSGTLNSATVTGNVGVSSGTINVSTISALPNIPGGTLGILAQGSINVTAGTITHGTIDAGTVKLDGRAARNIVSYGTTFGGTAAGYATLAGSAGAGTSIWVNDLSIINSKGGTITALVGFGTALNGTSVLAKGDFGAQGGIQKSFPLAVNAGMTNQDLVAYIGAAGTIDVCVSYFISA